MVPELPSGAVAQWPSLQLQSNKHQRHWKFRQLDSLCTAAEETSQSVNLRHARPSLFCSADTSQDWHSSAGLVYMLVWCESVQASWLCPPKLKDRASLIQSMWNVSVSQCIPCETFVCVKSSAACSRYSCHCGESCCTDPGDAGSSSKWVCWVTVKWAERIWTQQMKEAESVVGLVTQHGSEWRRSGPQDVAPTNAIMCVV